MILFTTGRGTPLGAPVPTVKIATSSRLASTKTAWIDFDAEQLLSDPDLSNSFFDYVISVANGKECANEKRGFREIAIFKNGVTL